MTTQRYIIAVGGEITHNSRTLVMGLWPEERALITRLRRMNRATGATFLKAMNAVLDRREAEAEQPRERRGAAHSEPAQHMMGDAGEVLA